MKQQGLLTVLLVAMTVLANSGVAATIHVSDDSYIRIEDGKKSSGSEGKIEICEGHGRGKPKDKGRRADRHKHHGGNDSRWCYVRFDFSTLPPDVLIADAVLRLFVGKVKSPGPVQVHLVLGEWDEETLTADNAPELLEQPLTTVVISKSDEGGFLAVDVTEAVLLWADGTAINYGLALLPAEGGGADVELDSKESKDTSHPMELEVTPEGPEGPQGEQGEKGEQGVQGISGLKGDTGDTGADGLPGDEGPKGENGDAGDVGPQGLKGDIGDVGPQGIQGDKGIPGLKGDTGDVGPRGIKGDTGAVGPQGLQGTQGLKGNTGDTGETGPQGLKGDAGPKGDKGDTGDIGPQGIQGDKGATGDIGDVGPEGIHGDKGIPGLKGDTGDVGPQGIQGEKGDPGDASSEGLVFASSNNVFTGTAIFEQAIEFPPQGNLSMGVFTNSPSL
jgi:hypothetical protein